MLQIKTSRRVLAEQAALADQIDFQLTAVISAPARSDFSRQLDPARWPANLEALIAGVAPLSDATVAGQLLGSIVPNIRKTSDLVQEITAASEEQSSGVGQINPVVTQLSQTTQRNASSSEQLAVIAEEMSGRAEQLQRTTPFFKLAGTNPATVRAKAPGRDRPASHAAPKPAPRPRANGFAVPVFAAGQPPNDAQFARF